ncbi:MAG: 2Fe-2S iron-sulfur cluster binding domain-containing protein [Burkholderiales bacterium]|nr:2Fe-2S iron-sulfur cluster binding domain-containing protein [Burkholderiales bacterium]
MHSLIIEGIGAPLDAADDRTVLDNCLDRGVPMPYNCRSGECGECLAQLVSGRLQELPGADPAIYTPALRDAGMFLTCMCYATSDITIRVPLRAGDAPPIRQFDAVITSVARFGTRTMRVEVRPQAPLVYHAGQYFEWHLPQLSAPRSYSAANAPGSETIEFLVRLHEGGGVSELLQRAELAAGDILTLKGPFGSYDLDVSGERPLIMVAGGTGLAPVKAIAESLAASGSRRSVSIYFGARDRDELGYARSLHELCASQPSMRFAPVLSHEPEPSPWQGARGLVTEHLAATLGDQFGAQAYLCGPPQMINQTIAILEAKGAMRSDIHCDKFSPAGSHGH